MSQRRKEAPGPAGAGEADEINAGDLERLGRLIGAVPIPAHLVGDVLTQVRAHRAAMSRIDEALITGEQAFADEPTRAPMGGTEPS